jgi:thiol-disulfide isomerase/thioredoxin
MSKIPVIHQLCRFVLALYTLASLGGCSHQEHQDKQAALNFTLPDTSGTRHTLADYRGRWVIVNYWATWCKPCRAEIPKLVTLSREYKDHKVVVLGVDYESIELKDLLGFMRKHHMSYPVLRTNPMEAQKLGPVLGLPTTYVITPHGDIATTLVGQITRKAIEQLIETESLQRGLPTPARNKQDIS